MSTRDSAGVSEVYAEEGELWLRVSPGHAVSERWLQERAPDLYAQWWAAPGAGVRDRLALQIEQRLEELEATGSWRQAAARSHELAEPSVLADRVARYEDDAERLGAIALDDPARAATHLAHQAEGDELRDQLAATPAGDARELLARRLDAADLVADRPFIEAVSGMTVEVDRLAVAALTDAGAHSASTVSADGIRAEMVAEDPHAALRADVLSAVTAAGHNPAELRSEIEQHGVDLARMAPALAPASDFYARHTPAIEARLDREITAGGFRDLPSYVASWQWGRPATASLHDTEQALVEHVVGDVITAADDNGRDVREAQRVWERAADRAAIREWSTALERGELELDVEQLRGPEQQLELGLHVDVDDDVDAGHDAEQEVG
jgi:hypothetical protein